MKSAGAGCNSSQGFDWKLVDCTTMPSKTKKSSKAQSRLSISDQIQSPRLSQANPATNSEIGDEDLVSFLEEASSVFPSLIGKSAFIGRVIDVEADFKGCKLWLSDASMVASSLVPGTIVSVSLVDGRTNFSNGFPLSLLGDRVGDSFEVDTFDKLANEPGSYFALASIYPSAKVLKDGVRLSSNLSHTLGCPTLGRTLFVYPLRNPLNSGMLNGGKKQLGSEVDFFQTCNCKELYLEFVSSNSRQSMNGIVLSSNNFHLENSYGEYGKENATSPKTPVPQSKLSSPTTRKLISPISKESVFSSSNLKNSSTDSFRIEEILKDKTAKKILQTYASSWLNFRCLLRGNLVIIPVLSELCTFRVVGASEFSSDNVTCDLNDRGHNYIHEAPELQDPRNYAFTISNQTRVLFSVSSSTNVPTLVPNGSLTSVDLGSKDLKVKGEISKLGGVSREYSFLKDIIAAASENTLSSFGLRTTKGVLLHGPPGTGKTSLARLCAYDAGVNFFSLNGPEIISQYYGESEQALNEVFESAMRAAPSVVFIDELDAIAPARKDGVEALSQRIVATLLNLMDGIGKSDGFIVIAATNRPDSIEPALRRPGRFDREIEIGVPSPKQRLDILLTLLSEMQHSLLDSQVRHLAVVTHGFVGADLAALCNEAALVCLRRFDKCKRFGNDCHYGGTTTCEVYCDDTMKEPKNLKDVRNNSLDGAVAGSSSSLCTIIPLDTLTSVSHLNHLVPDTGCWTNERCTLKVAFEDFEKARMKVRPSAMREVIIEVPKVKWEDVGGQREVKRQLMEAVEWPQKHQDAFERIGSRPPTGVLLFGPPGCSKTLMARAVSSEAGLNFLAVKGPELFSKWVGESEKAVRSLFAKARANAPSIIFFDEIDGLAVIRGKESDGISVSDRVMSQLLVEMDGLHQRVNVIVIAATNRPDKIDPALLRPGRFDRLLYVGPPNKIDREDIFRIHLRKIPCSSDVNVGELADLTKGCTGADISLICREAAVAAIEESLEASQITMQQLKTAIELVKPSETDPYQELSTKFQRFVISDDTGPEVRHELCTVQCGRFSFWNFIISVGLLPYRFLGNILYKSASTEQR